MSIPDVSWKVGFRQVTGLYCVQDGDGHPSLTGLMRFSEIRAVKEGVIPCVDHSWHLVQNGPLP